jgi:hypothetical protein
MKAKKQFLENFRSDWTGSEINSGANVLAFSNYYGLSLNFNCTSV